MGDLAVTYHMKPRRKQQVHGKHSALGQRRVMLEAEPIGGELHWNGVGYGGRIAEQDLEGAQLRIQRPQRVGDRAVADLDERLRELGVDRGELVLQSELSIDAESLAGRAVVQPVHLNPLEGQGDGRS